MICTDDAGESDDTRKEPQTAKDEEDGADSETDRPNEIESSKDCQPDAVDLPVSLKTWPKASLPRCTSWGVSLLLLL